MLLRSFCLSKVVHKKDGKVFGLIISLLLLIHTTEGQSEETDLSDIIKATTGDDVVLPCHVAPPGEQSMASVEWGRPDLMPRFVHIWYNQREYFSDQNTAYRGRTSLFHDKLKDGDVSLKLSNVRHSDNGKYRCYNPSDKTEYFVELLVGSVSPPGLSLAGLDKSSGGVMLDCSSAGWYPEPEVFWLDAAETILSAAHSETIKGPDGLYTVSSRVIVEKKHNNNVTCRVQQKDINKTRGTHFYIPDDFFMAQSGCSVHVTFIVIFVIVLIFGVFLLIWIKKQNKTKTKKREEKGNEEQQLMEGEKQYLAEKKSNLEEELKKRIQDQRSIDQLIEALMKMSEELKEQKEKVTHQKEEADKMAEENDKRLKAVVDEVENQKGNKTDKKAQGYLKLKEIMTESNNQLLDRRKSHEQMELMTQKLLSRTSDEVTKLKERKQELEKHEEEIKTHLKEMEAQM